jgi:hypothetical protein
MTRWKILLPVLCAITTVAVLATILDVFGFDAKPWFGFWDSVQAATGQPFIAQVTQSIPGGAAARAGLRDGDRIDLRAVSAYDRAALLFQPATIVPLNLKVLRHGKPVNVHVMPSTIYDGDVGLKLVTNVTWALSYVWALGCAWIVALRRWETREARYLCLILLSVVAVCLSPESGAWPGNFVGGLQYLALGVAVNATALLSLALAANFGPRSLLRKALEAVALGVIALNLVGYVGGAVGVLTAWVDPMPFAYGWWQALGPIVFSAVVVVAAVAIASTPQPERVRAAWLLLPMPLAILLNLVALDAQAVVTTWEAYVGLEATANTLMLLGAAAVTYALLKRRVLNVQFVIGRTLAVAGVSAVIVASFVLLEWLLGTVLAHVSHATGIVANAGLALGLGLSMSFIHKRVDTFVDFAFFHKRHEDERALRDFAKEAAFVTRRDELLDHTMGKLRAHTDAVAASVLLDGDGRFKVARWFGEAAPGAGENDEAVLAMKASHKALDPHRYTTELRGDLALPMLARGRVLGVLLCGARAGGEAYAPDEIDALADFAHGVGSALDSLERADLAQSQSEAILYELRALRVAIEASDRR